MLTAPSDDWFYSNILMKLRWAIETTKKDRIKLSDIASNELQMCFVPHQYAQTEYFLVTYKNLLTMFLGLSLDQIISQYLKWLNGFLYQSDLSLKREDWHSTSTKCFGEFLSIQKLLTIRYSNLRSNITLF